MSCDIHVINAEVIVGICPRHALESVLKRLKQAQNKGEQGKTDRVKLFEPITSA